jgi:hypothetical protein
MKSRLLPLVFAMYMAIDCLYASPSSGFFLPDSVNEFSFRYKSINNLIILPVRINDSVSVRLILDTGCRNLVLFGKRFKKLFDQYEERPVEFSGLGKGNPIQGLLTINNTVKFGSIAGNNISIVVVPGRSPFSAMHGIDGIIGYDVFYKFEVEINFPHQTITFRPAEFTKSLSSDFTIFPIRIENSKPVLTCNISFYENQDEAYELLIDTGSYLGLLITEPKRRYPRKMSELKILGEGLNGLVEGFETFATRVNIGNIELKEVPAAVVHSNAHHYASIGTKTLKDYTLILNYCKAYAALKK